ncbi:SprT family zinc-dependent metalloprotease [Celerinatantimonas yamalensis]|uniref:SprT family zinc-dependent metalloprotease n=1 Tax=Celerinatantimonas yamalensis TaxID=559956 RepID=A0ABW9GAL3_9GAMM
MQAIIDSCDTYCQRAEDYFERSFLRPQIRVDLRGQAAGQANLSRALLRFNPILYQENRQHFLRHTVGHEVAHWIAYSLYGSVRAHGREWQQIMTDVFDLRAERLHHYNTQSVIGPTYTYHCHCRTHQLTKRRHKAIQKGLVYCCRACQGTLTLATHSLLPIQTTFIKE